MKVYEELIRKAGDMKGFIVAALTDEYIVDVWPMVNSALNEVKMNKALEIRVFNDSREIKFFRSDIGKEFHCRVIDDSGDSVKIFDDESLVDDKIDFLEQEQFLDIDSNRSKAGENTLGHRIVTTTGGGKFYLPIDTSSAADDAKVIIRHYLRMDPESGMARVFDWRAVGFEEV